MSARRRKARAKERRHDRRRVKRTLVVSGGVAAASLGAQAPTAGAVEFELSQVRDIVAGSESSQPSELTRVGDSIFFQANDGTSGYELWRSDGTGPGTTLVEDINPGDTDSSPDSLTNVSGTLFFTVNDGTNGYELWSSDGTSGGTSLVEDIRSGTGSSYPSYLANMAGTVFFRANDGSTGVELWKATSSGADLVEDISAGGSSGPAYLTEVNGTLFFQANDGTSGRELWRSDGTGGTGTDRVIDIVPGPGPSTPGGFFNFNGTAGIWRRDAIDTAGGWQHDTLTEDLDLSYRAQLIGWKFKFLPHVVSPAEVPVEMNSFKSQQHRWAKGSIQTCMKLLPRILQSDQPLKVKAEAFFHLTANFNYLLMALLSVLMFPAMYVRYNMGWTEMLLIDIPLFVAATMSFFRFYMVSQRELYPDSWKSRLKYLPFLMSIGIGLAVNNTKAVFEALFHKPSEFVRTPKYAVEGTNDEWSQKKYRHSASLQPMIEVALGLYFTATLFYALSQGIYGTVPFLMLFQIGFLYTGLLSLMQQYGPDTVEVVQGKEA